MTENNNTFNHINDIVDVVEAMEAVKFDTVLPMSELDAVPVPVEYDEHGDVVSPGNVMLRVSSEPVDTRTPMDKFLGIPFEAKAQSVELPMTSTAYRQLMYRGDAGRMWKGMYDDVFPNLPEDGAALMNGIFRHERFNKNTRGEKQVLVRSNGEFADIPAAHRAVFSDQYVKIDMSHIAKIVQESVLNFEEMQNVEELMTTMQREFGAEVMVTNPEDMDGGIGHKLERVRVGMNSMSFRMRFNLQFHTPELGPFYTGLFVKTSEIGGSSVHILPYIFRLVCLNGMISSFERKELQFMRDGKGWAPIFQHKGGQLEDMEYKAKQAVAFALNYGGDLVNKARQAAYRSVPNANEILARMLGAAIKDEDVRNETLLIAGNGTEGESSVMGLVNGITAAAHNDDLTQDQKDSVEAIGGTALRLYEEDMSDKQIESMFLRLAKAELVEKEIV